MTVPEFTTGNDLTSLAVALGRIELSQNFTRNDVQEIKTSQVGANATLIAHAVKIQEHDSRLNAHDQAIAEGKPVRNSWTAVLSAVVAVVSVVIAVAAVTVN